MLPGTVHARFLASIDQVADPSNTPRANMVALAMECSKPEATKASRAHASTTSLAVSDRVLAAIQRARQTSMLHSTDRQNSWGPVAASFDAVIDATSLAPGPGSGGPPPGTRAANATEPATLPTSDATHTRARSTMRTRRAATPWAMTMTL